MRYGPLYNTVMNAIECLNSKGRLCIITFHSLEDRAVKNEDIVMATGGGIITTKENYNILKNEEKVIFLDGSVETIINHVQNERNQRPLLKESENLSKKIEELLSIRYEKYIEVSDILIDINGKNIDEVISQILVYIG